MKKRAENIQQKKGSGEGIGVLFVITFIMMSVILLVSFFGLHITTANRKIDELKYDWTISEGVQTKRVVLPDYVDLNELGRLEISHKIPESVTDSDVLLFLAEHQNLTVKIDGIVVYMFESLGVLNDYCGKAYQFINLSSSMAGKTMTFIFDVGNGVSGTHISLPVVGTEEAVVSYLIRKHIFVIICGSFFGIAGAALIVLAVVMLLLKKKKMALSSGLTGAFMLSVSLWQLLDTGILQLLGERESFMYVLSYSCHMLFTVPLLWYFAYKLEYRYRLLEFMCELGLLNIVVSMVIFITGYADLYQLKAVTELVIIISSMVLLYVLMIERAKEGVHRLTFPIVGVFLLIISGMLDIMQMMSVGGEIARTGSSVCYTVMLAVMFSSFVKDMIADIKA